MTRRAIFKFLLILLLFFAFVIGGVKAWVDWQLQQTMQQATLDLAQKNVLFHAQDAELTLAGGIELHDVALQSAQIPALEIANLHVPQVFRYLNADPQQLPPHLEFQLTDLHFSLGNQETNTPFWLTAANYDMVFLDTAALHKVGLAEIRADIEGVLQQQGDDWLVDLTIDAKAWGQWHLQATLQDLPAPAQWRAQAQSIRVVSASLVYQDRGLLNRLSSIMASQQEQRREALTQQLVNQLQTDLNQLRPALNSNSIRNLTRFLLEPQKLTIRLQPPEPLNWLDLQRLPPQQWLQAIGLVLENAAS